MTEKTFEDLYSIWKDLPTKKEKMEFEMRYSKYPISSWLSYHPNFTKYIILLFAIIYSIIIILTLKFGI